jgi:ribosomal protein S18 acetylase RimI-like enzyme
MIQYQDLKPNLKIEKLKKINSMDLSDLVDASASVMNETLGFNLGTQNFTPSHHENIANYWNGVILVPERILVVGRVDGIIASTVQVVKPSPSNQTSPFSCSLDNLFTATWARNLGLSNMMLDFAEKEITTLGLSVIRISIRETRTTAISLFEKRGYEKLGYLPKYELDQGKIVGGYFYYKEIN